MLNKKLSTCGFLAPTELGKFTIMALPGMRLHDVAVRTLVLTKLSNASALAEIPVEAAIWSIAPAQTQLDFQRNLFAAEDWKAVALSHSILAE